jgi:hypothetical protein
MLGLAAVADKGALAAGSPATRRRADVIATAPAAAPAANFRKPRLVNCIFQSFRHP